MSDDVRRRREEDGMAAEIEVDIRCDVAGCKGLIDNGDSVACWSCYEEVVDENVALKEQVKDLEFELEEAKELLELKE